MSPNMHIRHDVPVVTETMRALLRLVKEQGALPTHRGHEYEIDERIRPMTVRFSKNVEKRVAWIKEALRLLQQREVLMVKDGLIVLGPKAAGVKIDPTPTREVAQAAEQSRGRRDRGIGRGHGNRAPVGVVFSA